MNDPTRSRPYNRGEMPVEPPRPVRDVEPPRPVDDERSIMELIRSLGDDSRTLFRQEVTLARTEMREKLSVYEKNLVKIVMGAALLLGAVLVVLWAANMGLTALLSNFVDPAVAVWLAPLILGVLLALIGYSMLKGGTGQIREEGLIPEKTVQTLRDDKNWVKEQVRND